jgi:hypothetical protein
MIKHYKFLYYFLWGVCGAGILAELFSAWYTKRFPNSTSLLYIALFMWSRKAYRLDYLEELPIVFLETIHRTNTNTTAKILAAAEANKEIGKIVEEE